MNKVQSTTTEEVRIKNQTHVLSDELINDEKKCNYRLLYTLIF